ncbi:MAG: hypothetical protein AB7K09_12295 [Planctomycetota bacterium]
MAMLALAMACTGPAILPGSSSTAGANRNANRQPANTNTAPANANVPAPNRFAALIDDTGTAAASIRSALGPMPAGIRLAVMAAPWATNNDTEDGDDRDDSDIEARRDAIVAAMGEAAAASIPDLVSPLVSQAWARVNPRCIANALTGNSTELRALTRQIGADAMLVSVGSWEVPTASGLIAWSATSDVPIVTRRVTLPVEVPPCTALDPEETVLGRATSLPLTRIDAAVLVRGGFASPPSLLPTDNARIVAQQYVRIWFRATGAVDAVAWLIMPDGTAWSIWPEAPGRPLPEGAVLAAPTRAWLQLTTPGEYLLVIEALPALNPAPGQPGGPSRPGRSTSDGVVLPGAPAAWRQAVGRRLRDTLLATNICLALQQPVPADIGDGTGKRLVTGPTDRLEWLPTADAPPIRLVGAETYPVHAFPRCEPFEMWFGKDRLLQPDADPAATPDEAARASRLLVRFNAVAGIGGATWVWPLRVEEQ